MLRYRGGGGVGLQRLLERMVGQENVYISIVERLGGFMHIIDGFWIVNGLHRSA